MSEDCIWKLHQVAGSDGAYSIDWAARRSGCPSASIQTSVLGKLATAEMLCRSYSHVAFDPSENRRAKRSEKAEQACNSFELIAREWFTTYSVTWAEDDGVRIIRLFERDIFPWIVDDLSITSHRA